MAGQPARSGRLHATITLPTRYGLSQDFGSTLGCLRLSPAPMESASGRAIIADDAHVVNTTLTRALACRGRHRDLPLLNGNFAPGQGRHVGLPLHLLPYIRTLARRPTRPTRANPTSPGIQ